MVQYAQITCGFVKLYCKHKGNFHAFVLSVSHSRSHFILQEIIQGFFISCDTSIFSNEIHNLNFSPGAKVLIVSISDIDRKCFSNSFGIFD